MTIRSRLRHRAVAPPLLTLTLVGLLMSACTASQSPDRTPSSSPDPTRSVTPTGEPSDGPPGCLDAKLVWADSLDRLLLANCVDQFDAASVEQLWSWDGEAWELVDADGPPANVVTGFGWDPERDVLVRYCTAASTPMVPRWPTRGSGTAPGAASPVAERGRPRVSSR